MAKNQLRRAVQEVFLGEGVFSTLTPSFTHRRQADAAIATGDKRDFSASLPIGLSLIVFSFAAWASMTLLTRVTKCCRWRF
jgi:hypothetical protein